MAESLSGIAGSTPVNFVDRRRGGDRRTRAVPVRTPPDVLKAEFIEDVFAAMDDVDLKEGAAAALLGLDPATLSRIKQGHKNRDPKARSFQVDLLPLLGTAWERAFNERRDRRLGIDQASDETQQKVLDLAAFALSLAEKVV